MAQSERANYLPELTVCRALDNDMVLINLETSSLMNLDEGHDNCALDVYLKPQHCQSKNLNVVRKWMPHLDRGADFAKVF